MSAGRIRIAVATEDGITSDVNFGKANRFVLAEIDEGKITRKGEILSDSIMKEDLGSGCHGHDKTYLENLAKELTDCSYLIVRHIGNFPFRVLKSNGINVLEQTGEIDELLIKIAAYVSK